MNIPDDPRIAVPEAPSEGQESEPSDEALHGVQSPSGAFGSNMVATFYPSTASLPVPSTTEAVPPYVRRAIAGDARAFTELFQLHRRDVLRLASRLLGPRGDLEDVVQEVFIQVFRSIHAFRGDSRFSTWLHRVTVNVVLMHLRAGRSRPRLVGEPVNEQPIAENDSPLEKVAQSEQLRALYKILDSVSEKKRLVFILHDIQGVEAREIARIVEAPVLTVRTRLFYARREVYAAMANDPALEAIAKTLGTDEEAP